MGEPATNQRYTTAPLSPARASGRPADYTLERRLQKRYKHLLFEGVAGPAALDHLLESVFPKYFNGSQKERCQQYWQAEERVQYDIPEVIAKLDRASLRRLATYLDAGDLAQAIRYCWYELRPVLRRMYHPDAYQPRRHIVPLVWGTEASACVKGRRAVPAKPRTPSSLDLRKNSSSSDKEPSSLRGGLPTHGNATACCAQCAAQVSAHHLLPISQSPPGQLILESIQVPATQPLSSHHTRVKQTQKRRRLKRHHR
jgi:hypothetical protein